MKIIEIREKNSYSNCRNEGNAPSFKMGFCHCISCSKVSVFIQAAVTKIP